MTTIRILIYTDSEEVSKNPDADWSVSILNSMLEAKKSAFAEYTLEVINRYEGFPKEPEVPRKLTDDLLKGFDEIWFFGVYQRKVDQSWASLHGGCDNELDPDEVKALDRWMTTGGVLMSGDHSIYDPAGRPEDDPETFLCLGKALGHLVPRAGQLRKWVGPPTNDKKSFNTLANHLTSPDPEEDDAPQVLHLIKDENDLVHPLFHGKDNQGKDILLQIFPGHIHEGRVVIPEKFDCQWPHHDDDSQTPKPTIVAFGCDKRFCEPGPVLAVYDGGAVEVGRIVADSSWHHFFDVNLHKLKPATTDLLSQFYTNLALYLAPLSKRQEISRALFDWLVHRPDVKEERGNTPLRIGRVAFRRLSQVATPFELHELIQSVLPQAMESRGQFLNFQAIASPLPSPELVLGSIINEHYEAASSRLRTDVAPATFSLENVVAGGLRKAIRAHREDLLLAASVK